MEGDAYRDMTHYEIQQFIWRKVAKFADYANIEQRLENGRKADVYYQVGRTTVIVEVKHVLKESLFDQAWGKYAAYCDYLVMAGRPQLVTDDQYQPLSIPRRMSLLRIGVWLVDWSGISEVRPACRLQAVTLAHAIRMSPALSPCTVIGSSACTAHTP